MELANSHQISSDKLQNQKFDAFIAVSGYESRGTYLASQVDLSKIPNKIVLAFNEKKELLYREINDKKFNELGFQFYEVSAEDSTVLTKIFEDLFYRLKKENIDILIDYSSMPKIWYYDMINYFIMDEDTFSNVNLWFSYSPSEYTRSVTAISNKYLDPIKPQVQGKKPITLILGLGYEKGRAEELAKLLNAQLTFAFYADPAVDSRYVNEVLQNNQAVLKKIKKEQIISYPIFDLNSVSDLLTQLCINLRMEHQILLVPVGPKPFTLMCFILAARYPDIRICRVSSVINSVATDRKAHGELLVYKVEFTNEEVDY